MNTLKSILLTILAMLTGDMLVAQVDSVFYTQPVEYKIIKNFVEDYGVDNDFNTDDSEAFQQAINQISKKGGGKLIIPKGNYSFREIQVKSNVHLIFDPEVVIRPTQNDSPKNYKIFSFGEKSSVENISLTSRDPEKMLIIDLTQVSNFKVAVFVLRNVSNFYFSNILVKDTQTIFSCFTFGITPYIGDYFSPQNGIIRNCTVTNADYGYGLVQVQSAKNVLFENIGGEGGITLRLETGAKEMNNLQKGGVFDIVGRNIECYSRLGIEL